jgi:hypothetical protein
MTSSNRAKASQIQTTTKQTQTTTSQIQSTTKQAQMTFDSAMTNAELLLKTELAVKTERRSTSEVVRLFQEISNRQLFLERGFPNLYEMATKHFGYCAGS